MTVAGGGTLDLNGFNQTVPGVINAGLVTMGSGIAPGTVLTTLDDRFHETCIMEPMV